MGPSTVRADARANRVRVLAAAIAVFAERGTEAEMREIAERAGVAVGTVYGHFPGKQELLAVVLDEAWREFEASLAQAEGEADPVVALRAFVRTGLAIVERYGELMTALQDGRVPAVRDAARARARRAVFQERVAALVRHGVEAGALRPDLNPHVAGAVLHSVLAPWTFVELRRLHAPDQITDALMAIFLDGARR